MSLMVGAPCIGSDLQVYKIGKPSRREQGKIEGCPNIQGGVNFFPTWYSPRTHLSYGGGIEVARTSPLIRPTMTMASFV